MQERSSIFQLFWRSTSNGAGGPSKWGRLYRSTPLGSDSRPDLYIVLIDSESGAESVNERASERTNAGRLSAMEALVASSSPLAESRLLSRASTISSSLTTSSSVVSFLPFPRNALVAAKAQRLVVKRSSAGMQQKRVLAVSCAAADGNAVATTETAAAESTPAEVPIEKRYPAFPSVLDINAIRNILPHRFPFLLVDRVIEYNPGVSAVAIKNVTINDNFFPGHFPERPIMPGVLMVEAMAQVGGIVMLQPDVGGSKETFFFAGVDKVRFRKPVIAGDTLVMRMNLIKLQKRFGIAKMEGKAYVGGDLVCEGEFLMALGSEE